MDSVMKGLMGQCTLQNFWARTAPAADDDDEVEEDAKNVNRSTACRVPGGQDRCRSHAPAVAADDDRALPAAPPPRGVLLACWTPAEPTETSPRPILCADTTWCNDRV